MSCHSPSVTYSSIGAANMMGMRWGWEYKSPYKPLKGVHRMYQLLLVGSMLGCLVSTTAVTQAATDATDATNDVTATASSRASTNSQGYEFAAPPATNADLIYRVDRVHRRGWRLCVFC